MRLRFPAQFDLKDYQRLNITKSDDLLILKYPEVYRDKIRVEMRKIVEKNAKNEANGKEPVELDVSIDIHYQKRSTTFNSWMWAVHTLEANILNAKRSAWTDDQRLRWRETNAITPEMIHESDMVEFAPIARIDVEPDNVPFLCKVLEEESGRVINREPNGAGKVTITIRQTSSYWDVRRAAEYGDILKNRLLSYGISLDDSVDYRNIVADFDTWKKEEASKIAFNAESNIETATGTEDIPVLHLRRDSVSIVASVFNGELIND